MCISQWAEYFPLVLFFVVHKFPYFCARVIRWSKQKYLFGKMSNIFYHDTIFTGIRKTYETTRYFDPQHYLRNAFNRFNGQSIVVSCNNFRLNSTNVKLKMTNTLSGFVIVNWWERAGRGYRYITTALFVPNSRPGSGTRFHILSHPKWQ